MELGNNTASSAKANDALEYVRREFAARILAEQATCEGMPTVWVDRQDIKALLRALRDDASPRFEMLFDVTAIDERLRVHREGQPDSAFTVVYHLMSFRGNCDFRIKVPLAENDIELPTVTDLWASASWYEREVWDMFGITFAGHPNLHRLVLPPTWEGHPLRKEHPARATEMEPYSLSDEDQDYEQEALKFKPEDWGMKRESENSEFMFLNLGPNHPSVHGAFRVALQLDGEVLVDAVPDIGYHHRGAEKMGERQTWHTFIPYTDRIDYLGGVMNNLPYVMAVEKMAGIKVPERVKVIRIMLCEMFRICSHLLFYGTFTQDVGQLSPIFYMFVERERIFNIIESICGARMHPGWFRIGGVAQDLPNGWEKLVQELLDFMPPRLDEYDSMVMNNGILKRRTQGIGAYDTEQAFNWGVTGAGLRATGLEWDFRKQRPYSGYDQMEFDVPIAVNGDCYDRCAVRAEEMRQSLRIIKQCLDNMPLGEYKSDHPLTTPPRKENTMQDIETLINHFLSVSWGPVIPENEVTMAVEATKGINSYYLISDGGTNSYRTRIRTPSFAHLQMIPEISRGFMVSDLIAIIASIDFVMADVDR
ncbi:MAG: NADH-quinone oxidoreductase subunit C/D [Gammaproteobacteria bacterium]|jgi:NADH-quinone oxidoreductase subunit C/D|nr:NADH-quinone oxidoreductase subunit C/D [Gammaproteobacteria bacterium]MBT3858713.1 NADH-quinone oxidoreductase subunit C/D [Gammaproteobacteria bacterium]MBT3986065.1 NADH-quinone oxidoreductase subunit C/D [Gammaproteobacteria bacterium]MBT4257177.1 NADH-quinone oxidoreductase subunit C/D [Gammaproteobacteria bacterium]MBT4580776.1 NADH-quinone oxidoreductase subunit C/D [Gammaproteobacteria bacterium]